MKKCLLALLSGVLVLWPATAHAYTGQTVIYYADHTQAVSVEDLDKANVGWPVEDQIRRYDKSDRITLMPVDDCTPDLPGRCISIEVHSGMPDFYQAQLDAIGRTTPPFAVTVNYNGDRPVVWLTDVWDARWLDFSNQVGRNFIGREHATILCHELGHALTMMGDELHALAKSQGQRGCMVNGAATFPGHRLRDLIPS